MRVLVTRQAGLGSWLIRLFTWSPWSHCAVVDGDEVIDSTLAHGVAVRPLLEFMRAYDEIELLEVDVQDEAAALAWLRAQVGKPYDWSALFGFLMRRDWAEPDRWFCSELVEATIVAGGRHRFRLALARITPRDVWMVAP